jgi:hypothetical protein
VRLSALGEEEDSVEPGDIHRKEVAVVCDLPHEVVVGSLDAVVMCKGRMMNIFRFYSSL